MSFHELVSSYPWTAKRAIRLLDKNPEIPRRNPLAYLLALFVPYAGRMGAGMGMSPEAAMVESAMLPVPFNSTFPLSR